MDKIIEAILSKSKRINVYSGHESIDTSVAITLVREAFEGKTLVPDEPTVAMNNGGNVALTKGYQQGLIQSSDIYRAMLAASAGEE